MASKSADHGVELNRCVIDLYSSFEAPSTTMLPIASRVLFPCVGEEFGLNGYPSSQQVYRPRPVEATLLKLESGPGYGVLVVVLLDLGVVETTRGETGP